MNMENMMKEEPHYIPEPMAAPAVPIAKEEVENLPEEEMYKSILENSGEQVTQVEETEQNSSETPSTTKTMVNYESMTKAELTTLCEKRSIKVGKRPARSDLINALRKNDGDSISMPTTTQEVEGMPFSESDVFPLSATIEEVSA